MKLLNPIPSWKNFPYGDTVVAISQGFGERPEVYAQFGWKGHNGLDIAAPLGTPVCAMADGWIVEATQKDTGYGLRITQYFEQEEKGYDLTYGHFQKINYPNLTFNIQRRDYPVKAGDIIGYVDSTGFSSGNHLHITLRPYIWRSYQLEAPDNGFGGAIDILPFIYKQTMSNAYFVKNGNEYAIALPATSPEALIDKSKNVGLSIPMQGNNINWVELDKISKKVI